MDSLTVSIIIPHYNRGGLLKETLGSIAHQSYPNYQCIVVDDWSDDGSYEILQEKTIDNDRVKLIRRSNPSKGGSVCRNEGIALAESDYMMFLDSDDLMDPDCLLRRVNLMQLPENADSDFIVTQTALFEHSNYQANRLHSDLIGDDDLSLFLHMRGWGTSSTFFRTTFAKKLAFDEEAMSWQDIEFHIRLLLRRPNYRKYPDSVPDVYKRFGGGDQVSGTNQGFVRIESLLKLFRRLEYDLEGENIEYKEPFLMYYFKFLEIAARLCSKKEFDQLMELWESSPTYRHPKADLFRRYLRTQANISKFGLYKVGSIPYRLIRFSFPNDVLNFHAKHVEIDPPIDIKQQLRYHDY